MPKYNAHRQSRWLITWDRVQKPLPWGSLTWTRSCKLWCPQGRWWRWLSPPVGWSTGPSLRRCDRWARSLSTRSSRRAPRRSPSGWRRGRLRHSWQWRSSQDQLKQESTCDLDIKLTETIQITSMMCVFHVRFPLLQAYHLILRSHTEPIWLALGNQSNLNKKACSADVGSVILWPKQPFKGFV